MMEGLKGRIAVLTGGGTGMGRELARQLAAAGCHVAMCDISVENMEQTRTLCEADAPAGVRVTTHLADVSLESDVQRFRDEVVHEHQTECVQNPKRLTPPNSSNGCARECSCPSPNWAFNPCGAVP